MKKNGGQEKQKTRKAKAIAAATTKMETGMKAEAPEKRRERKNRHANKAGKDAEKKEAKPPLEKKGKPEKRGNGAAGKKAGGKNGKRQHKNERPEKQKSIREKTQKLEKRGRQTGKLALQMNKLVHY